MRVLRNQHGFLMIVAVGLVTTLSLLTSAIVYNHLSHTRSYSDFRNSERSYHIAKSGLEHGKLVLENGNALSDLNIEKSYHCSDINFIQTIGGGEYIISGEIYNPPSVILRDDISSDSNLILATGDVTDYAAPGLLFIDNEIIAHKTIITSGDNCSANQPCFSDLVRGIGDTEPALHAAGASISEDICQLTAIASAPSLVTSDGYAFGQKQLTQNIVNQLDQYWGVGKKTSNLNIIQGNGSSWEQIDNGFSKKDMYAISVVTESFATISGYNRTFYAWNGSAWSEMDVDTSGDNAVPNKKFYAISCTDWDFCIAAG